MAFFQTESNWIQDQMWVFRKNWTATELKFKKKIFILHIPTLLRGMWDVAPLVVNVVSTNFKFTRD